jgi:hypothetical protein
VEVVEEAMVDFQMFQAQILKGRRWFKIKKQEYFKSMLVDW